MASVGSAVPRVRENLFSLQRSLAGDMSVVMDGRDIGTTILPDAEVKIFLTASSLPARKDVILEFRRKELSVLDEILPGYPRQGSQGYDAGNLTPSSGRGRSACGFLRYDHFSGGTADPRSSAGKEAKN